LRTLHARGRRGQPYNGLAAGGLTVDFGRVASSPTHSFSELVGSS
jgi:hypothetical protein